MRKVLILHQHFKTPQTGGAIRSYYLAKSLVDRGIQATVITTHNEANDRVEDVEGIEVHYLSIPYDNKFGFYKRSFSFVQYILRSASLAGRLKDVDVCYAISVPLTTGVAAQWINARHKIPYYFEVGDLWPEAPIQMGFVKNYFFKQFLDQLAKSIYRGASAVVALSPMIQASIGKVVPGKKIHLIPNMADLDFYHPESKRADLEARFQVAGKFVVSYTGALGVANGLEFFLECAGLSQRADLPVHFLVCGEGAMTDSLMQIAQQKQLRNLTFLGFLKREGVREVMNVTDASFVCYKPVPVLETGSPNKYFDALAGGKLVIVNFGGWIRDEIEKEGCGFHVDATRPNEFVQKLNAFLNDRHLLEESQRRSRQLAVKKYSRKELGQFFSNLFSGDSSL